MKKIVREIIYSKHFEEDEDIRFSDLPKDIQDNDVIDIHKEDEFHSENNSYDAHKRLIVDREREETDENNKQREL